MSYYGGGGGWGPPGFYHPNQGVGMPPIQQPPPTAYFHSDPAGYAQGRGPYDYVQPGTGYSVPTPSHSHGQPGTHPAPDLTGTPQTALYSSVPPPQQQTLTGVARNSPLVSEKGRTSLERSRDSRTPPRQRSPSPDDRYERRPAVSRRRDSSPGDFRYRRRRSPSESPDRRREIPQESKLDLDARFRRDPSPEEFRYRQRRSPGNSPDRPYSGGPRPRGRSPETFERNYARGRKDESQVSGETQQKSKPDHSGVDLDALLKDERLRNVLFAGITKATAKLEQSLKQDTETKDNVAFLAGSLNDAKSQLFPSASTSGGSQQKPRSILKRKTDSDESGNTGAALSNLNTLEKTLQMLRNKTDTAESSVVSSREQSNSKAGSKLHGALGQLVSYDDDNEDDAYLYRKDEELPTEKKKIPPSAHPFWSVDAVAAKREEEKKAPDTFEMKDKMFEKWRRSIQKSPERQLSQGKDLVRGQSYEKESRAAASRPGLGKSDENQEELDSTVQNILQSIGFDFDLSQRMQQLARKKKIQEEEKNTGISNLSASFLGKSSILTEELKASLLQSGNDLSKIDSLLQEARACVHLERSVKRRERSPSPVTRRGRSPVIDRAVMIKDRLKAKMNLSDWPDQIDESRRHITPHVSREYEASSSRDCHFLEDRGARSAFRVLDDVKDEYFYPEKDPGEVPPGVPLLTSYSSRQKSEDLSSGLLKSMRVENFRVMSRPVYDDENEEFTETRRIILPAKSERKVLSKSPSARDSRSPSYTRGVRKRSGSPLSVSSLKERKVMSRRGGSFIEAQQKSPIYERHSPINQRSLSPERSPNDRAGARRRESISPQARRRLSGRRRSTSPRSPKSKYRQRERSRSPAIRRSRSPRRYRSRSPIRRRSRSRSPRRRRSRSRSRHRKSSPRYTSPLRDRRRPLPRKSPEKKSSTKLDPKASVDKKGMSFGKKDTNAKAQVNSGQPLAATLVDLSKMTDDERKSHLKKMLAEKDGAPVIPETPKPKQNDNVKTIVESFEKLASSLNPDKKAELSTKLKLLSADDQLKVLDNVNSRFSKIMLLKIEVVKLRKQQNELMRKNQRRGIGSEDPQLSVNERKQGRIEKEIERLSATELEVEVGEFSLEVADESSQKDSSNTPQDRTSSKKKTTGNLIEVPLSKPGNKKKMEPKFQSNKDAEPVSKTESSGKKKTATAVTKYETKKPHTPSESGKNSWTSVDVKDELPVIDVGDTPKGERPAKKGSASDSTMKTTTKRKIYYEYIDSGNHFCCHCHVTCNTLNQFFEHLHGRKHVRAISKLSKPWDEPKITKGKNLKVGQAQSRRVKGSELIVPVTGFYCSLCKVFCGDFSVTENHLKSDSHYDKYLDYIRDNPKYEKNLLLEKTKSPGSSTLKKSPSVQEKEEKGREKKAHLRVKTEKEMEKDDEDLSAYDQIGAVDMELDEDNRDDDRDVQSKVPKMVPKSLPFIPPPPPEPAVINTMKTNKEDKDQSLEDFLTIKQEAKQGEKIPVVCSHASIDLSSIPVPAALPPALPKVEQVCTVKSLQEVQNEEKKAMDEEKRMMGIDVDAEEEKPLAVIKRPPIFQNVTAVTSEATTAVEGQPKRTSVDNLFAKLNKSAAQKRKPKVVSSLGREATEMEMRIQQEITEKLDKEKEKLLRKKQKAEERERRREERKLQKKKIYSSSESSSEESEEEDEDFVKKTDLPEITLPDASSQNLQNPALDAKTESQVDEPSSGFVTSSTAIDSFNNEAYTTKDMTKSAEVKEEKSNNEGTNVEISEVIAGAEEDDVSVETVKKGKTPVKKKNSTGTVSATESDLSMVFTHSLETVSREAQKKLHKRGGVRKRGRHPKPCQNVEGKEIVMEDYVVLSEITEEDENVMKEDIEIKDEGEVFSALMSDTSSMQVENVDDSLQVQEVDVDGDISKNTPIQELEMTEKFRKTEEETWKYDATSGDKLSADDGYSVEEEKKEQESVEEPSAQPSDNWQLANNTDKGQELLSASVVDDEVPNEESLKNSAAAGGKLSGVEGHSESVGEEEKKEKTVEKISAQPADNQESAKHAEEDQELFSSSNVDDEGNMQSNAAAEGKLFSDDGHSESVDEENRKEITVVETFAQPPDNGESVKHVEEAQELFSSSIVDEVVPKEENWMNDAAPRQNLSQDDWHSNSVSAVEMEEMICEKPTSELNDRGQSDQHNDEAQEFFSVSLVTDEVTGEEDLKTDEKQCADDWHSKSVGEMEMEEKTFVEPSAEPSDNWQSEKHTSEAQEALIPDLDVPSEPDKHDIANMEDEKLESVVPILSQEVPITLQAQPSELRARTLVQEVVPAMEKDAENATEERCAVLSVPATAHCGGRGRGKKSGGRGRGRGKRAAKKGREADSPATDEFPLKADDTHLKHETPSVDDTSAISAYEEADTDNKTSPSPSRRGRRAKALSTPRRVTRSRINQIQNEASNDENMNEPTTTAVEEEKQIDVSVIKPSRTTSQRVGQKAGLQSVDDRTDADQCSSEVGIESLETTSFNPDVSMEDIQVIPTLTEQPHLSSDPLPVSDLKDGSDSDATITEDQEIVESQNNFDVSKTTPQVMDMPSMKSLVESSDACLVGQGDQGQGMTMSETGSLWDQTYHDDTEDSSAITVVHLHTDQPRDPPMSGIVSEIEAPDNFMDVDGDGVDDTDTARPEVNIPESEGLPTSGLGLDLEDVTESISFPLDSSEPM